MPERCVQMVDSIESKRIRKLRSEIISSIPRVPNNRDSLVALQKKHFTDLLIVFINWQLRFVGQRKRRVVVDDSAKIDPRWNLLREQIETFLDRVRNGEDLAPFLSLKARKRGFSLSADNPSSSDDSWDDKDFSLNVTGCHHFHLGELKSGMVHSERTNDILFAHVTKDTFTVLAILNHSVFESPDNPPEPLTQDREFLWTIFNERSLRGALPGSVVVPSMIATSGHSLNAVMAAQEYVRVIREIDPKLDDIEFVRSLYEGSGIEEVNTKKLVWHFRHLDLGVYDPTSGFLVSLDMVQIKGTSNRHNKSLHRGRQIARR